VIFLIAVSVLWAFSFPLIKVYLTTLDANFVALARMALALLVLLPFLRVRKLESRLALRLVAIGALQMGVMYVAYIRSFQYLQSYEVAVLTIMTPLWITLFSSVLTRSFEPRFYVATGLAVVGAAIIALRQEAIGPALAGVALVQVSNIAFGAGQILYKRTMASHPGVESHEVFALLYAGAVVVTLAATSFTLDCSTLAPTTTQAIVLVYLGIVAAGIGFFLWNHGATKVNDGTLAVMNNGYMPLAVIAGLVWLGEEVDPIRLIIGAVLIVSGLFVTERVRKPAEGTPAS
jgi:drug/metabolite transporter (DMT)-like permease